MRLGKGPEMSATLDALELRLAGYLLRSSIFCKAVAAIASCELCARKGVLFKMGETLRP
jgi:hypothetical protein